MDRLRAILDLIDKYFPDCQMINMDATVTSIRLKSDEELQELYDRKVRHLYLGIDVYKRQGMQTSGVLWHRMVPGGWSILPGTCIFNERHCDNWN